MIERGNPLWKAPLGQGHTKVPIKSISVGEDQARSSQEWKRNNLDDRTAQPVVYPQRGARPQQFIIGDDETESELSLGSRSFLNRVNDQVRKRQKRSSMNVTENDEKHSMIW